MLTCRMFDMCTAPSLVYYFVFSLYFAVEVPAKRQQKLNAKSQFSSDNCQKKKF